VRLLLSRNSVDVNLRANREYTPLHVAIIEGRVEVASLLLTHSKVQSNTQDCNGYTPLHCTVGVCSVRALRLLLTRDDVRIDVKDKSGRNALEWVMSRPHAEITKFLQDAVTSRKAQELELTLGVTDRNEP